MRIFRELFHYVCRVCALMSGLMVLAALGAPVPTAFAEDVAALRQRAERGDAKSQFMLGMLYGVGRDVPQDARQMDYWLRKAAEQGYVEAQGMLCFGYAQAEMRGIELSPATLQEGVKWCGNAASKGHSVAQYLLGRMYEKGLGVQQDIRTAKTWYRKAAAQGIGEAHEALHELESGTATGPNSQNTTLVEQACVFVASLGYNGLSTGSGFFVAPGYVVTNAHVLAGAREALVSSLAMRQPSVAQVVAMSGSGERDYAVLRLDLADCGHIRPLKFAANTRRAERVGAWGFPGLINEADPNYYRFLEGDVSAIPSLAYTEGVVNAIVERNPVIIVHSAEISHGNSGGPLVNANGDVVGINTSIEPDDRSYRQLSIALSGRDLLQFLRNNGIPAQSR